MGSETAKVSHALDMLRFKCWYYEQAIQDGGEDRVKGRPSCRREKSEASQ